MVVGIYHCLSLLLTYLPAVFAFMGSELVGVTVGEAQNPRKNIPRGILPTSRLQC